MKTKLLSLLMVFVLLLGTFGQTVALAQDDATAPDKTSTADSKSESTTNKEENEKAKEEAKRLLEEQQALLQKNLEEAEKRLAQLEVSSKGTAEYIDTLDQKIGYMNEQLTVLEDQNFSIQEEINMLLPVIEENEQKLSVLSEEVEKTKQELQKLQDKFDSVYAAYCARMRVIYISGDFNILAALITCKDISSLLTRYEMIKSVSKSDADLLKEVQARTQEIITKQNGLDERVAEYEKAKSELDSQKSVLESKLQTIERNSEVIASNKATLATDRAESDRLLALLTAQNKQYTEFRNEDSEISAAVENEIQALISGLKKPQEVTTAVIGDRPDDLDFDDIEAPEAQIYANSDAVLNMTYPVPGNTRISAGYPNYSSGQYHGGIDFPCSTGSAVVAAQDGIVVTVKRLDYSYGYYVMIYHGTDARGRSVVTLYAHNSSILVSNGQNVRKGEQIAKSGSTGNSTGPHCHFEVRFNGTRANPKNYLS